MTRHDSRRDSRLNLSRVWHERGHKIEAYQTGIGTWRARIDGVELTGLHAQWPTAWNAYRGAVAHLEREQP